VTKNIAYAVQGNDSQRRRLSLTTGPAMSVTGDASRPRSGMLVLSARLPPRGRFNQELKKTSCPCNKANGVQARNHTVWAGSWAPPQAQLARREPSHGRLELAARPSRA
jgi:hypothetical protein